ncbi:iron reductase [Mycobacterium novum]
MAPRGENPLTAGMDDQRPLALHESCQRLRELHPLYPRTYGVTVLAEVNKRRWCPMDSVLTIDRLGSVFDETATVAGRRMAGNLLAGRLTHEVLGRVLPVALLEGRAWDTGLENLWVHFDSDNDIDWAAVVDPTMRVLPDDPAIGYDGRPLHRDAVVVLPDESALITWVAHRCHRALAPLFVWLHGVSERAVPVASMWQAVGSAVVMAASQLRRLPGNNEAVSFRRSQAMLDVMAGFGLPVRGTTAPSRRVESLACTLAAHERPQPAGRHLRALSHVPAPAAAGRGDRTPR